VDALDLAERREALGILEHAASIPRSKRHAVVPRNPSPAVGSGTYASVFVDDATVQVLSRL